MTDEQFHRDVVESLTRIETNLDNHLEHHERQNTSFRSNVAIAIAGLAAVGAILAAVGAL